MQRDPAGRARCTAGGCPAASPAGDSGRCWRRWRSPRRTGRRSATPPAGTASACDARAGSRRCRCRAAGCAVCRSSRSRSARPCSSRKLVEQPRRQHRHVAAVRAVEPEAVTDRLGARQHLPLEVLALRAAAGLDEDRAACRPAARRRRRPGGARRSPTAASGRRAAPARASRPRPPAAGSGSRGRRRPAARPRRRTPGMPRAGSRGRLRRPRRSWICEAAKRTSPPIATICVTRRSGISRRISSMTLAMERLSSATCRSWPCRRRSSCWRSRTAPSA